MKRRTPANPLSTRHVFLDTEVYNKLKHNVANRALTLLSQHVAGHRIVLHVTDITLAEIKRQLFESVEQARAALARIEKDLARWRHFDARVAKIPDVDASTAERQFEALETFLRTECRAKVHEASAFPAIDVFADYFGRKPPFDKGEKEFPDSFMVKALEAWCATSGEQMYVVTKDGAMQGFVAASPHLLSLATIDEILAMAVASSEPASEIDDAADRLINRQDFDDHLESAIGSHVDELIVAYHGDLAEGEVSAVDLEGVIQFVDYRVVSQTGGRIGLLIRADTEISTTLTYENRDLAMYDREDGLWIGADWETTEVKGSIPIELFVEVDVASGKIVTSELLRTEYTIH